MSHRTISGRAVGYLLTLTLCVSALLPRTLAAQAHLTTITITPSEGSYSYDPTYGPTRPIDVEMEICGGRWIDMSTFLVQMNGETVSDLQYEYYPLPFCNGSTYRAWGTVYTTQYGWNDLYAVVEDEAGYFGEGSAQYFLESPPSGGGPPGGGAPVGVAPWGPLVTITPNQQLRLAPAGQPRTQHFTVHNRGTSAANLVLEWSCIAPVSCSGGSTSEPVQPGASFTRALTFTMADASTEGSIAFSATGTFAAGGQSIQALGGLRVRRGLAPESVLTAPLAAPLAARGHCLTLPASADAIYECGDLRLAYAFPVVVRRSQAYSATLLYNSGHVNPVVLAPVDLTLSAPADSVIVLASVAGGASHRTAFPGWAVSTARRMNVRVADIAIPTGVTTASFEVRRRNGSTFTTIQTFTREIVIVNRTASHFGAGWWLAGHEQLVSLAGGRWLWIGGDGSAHVYQPVPGVTGAWVAPKIDGVDSLRQSGTAYYRRLADGLRVYFNAAGQHDSTVNRHGQLTRFEYASGRLWKIHLPGNALGYELLYSAAGKLQTVKTYDAAGGVRTTTLVPGSPGQIARIHTNWETGATDGIRFRYSGSTGRILRRIDRGGDSTTFSFGQGGKLTGSTIHIGSAVDPDVVRSYEPVEARGYLGTGVGIALTPYEARTALIGPRTDVEQVTRFWLNALGGPRRIEDAMGGETVVSFDPSWPGLATRVRHPSGRVTTARYGASRGLVEATYDSVAVRDYSTGTSAWSQVTRVDSTRYHWHPVWDRPDSIAPMLGDTLFFGYDPQGNQLWRQPGRNAARRVDFAYYGSGLLAGLPRAVKAPLVARDSIEYDALGNVAAVKNPAGHWTLYHKDALGRDTLILSPIDSLDRTRNPGSYARQRQRITYDAASRPWVTRTTGPRVLGAVSHDSVALEVSYEYDKESRPLIVWSASIPDSLWIDQTSESWAYDDAGRVIHRSTSSGTSDEMKVDAAGNVIALVTADGDTIRMVYDALDRPIERVVSSVSYGARTCPEEVGLQPLCGLTFPFTNGSVVTPFDVQRFVHDVAGNATLAANVYATVSRTYNQDGSIATDVSTVIPYAGTTPFANTLEYSYDALGRRDRLHMNGAFRQSWTYDPARGVLAQTSDVWGNTFSFGSDDAHRQTSQAGPFGVTETWQYDGFGRLQLRQEKRGTATIHHDGWRYDARGKVLQIVGSSAPSGGLAADVYDMRYTGLGAVYHSMFSKEGVPWTEERFRVDAFGNAYWTRSSTNGTTLTSRQRYDGMSHRQISASYDPAVQLTANRPLADSVRTSYRFGGNTQFTATWPMHVNSAGNPIVDAPFGTASYFTADGKPYYFQRSGEETGRGSRSVYEEYWYDALGRRVLTRSRRSQACLDHFTSEPEKCHSAIERYVWDDDRMLEEVRNPGGMTDDLDDTGNVPDDHFGRMRYTHGGALDHPLAVTLGTTTPWSIVPHANWRGLYDEGTSAGGVVTWVEWPGRDSKLFFAEENPDTEPERWIGSLLSGKRDQSGLLYMRNRYFDPAKGRFTQEDPIGIAGGLNTYGFAGGDPVNYSDPFGLCTPQPECLQGLGSLRNQWDSFKAGAASALAGVGEELRDIASTVGAFLSRPDVQRTMVVIGAAMMDPDPGPAGDINTIQTATARTSFVVTRGGTAIAIPRGATGPTATRAPGVQYTGGTGGGFNLHTNVTGVRIMDQTAHHPRRAMYMNSQGQTVNPETGRTVPKSHPLAHLIIPKEQ